MNVRISKFSRLPKGYSKLAVAAWKTLSEQELYQVGEQLVFTDDIDAYLSGDENIVFSVDIFDSHEEFEKWLLECVAEWCSSFPEMVEELETHITLK